MLLATAAGRPDRFGGLFTVDYTVVVLYFIAMLGLGYYFSKQQKSTEEYFMAGRGMPWFVVGLSMFATLLSTVSYLSTPGEFIKNGPGIWGTQMHIPFTITLVTVILILYFMRKSLTSAYEYLEELYGLKTRLFASTFFLLIRLFSMGMIVYTASFAMTQMTGVPFIWVVLGIWIIGIVYTTMGGMRAIIWTDVAQFFILFFGLIITIGFVVTETGTGPVTWFHNVMQVEGEPQPFFAFDPYVRVSLLGAAIYGLFWWTCTAGSDQVAIQRYLTTGSLKGARKSFLANIGADLSIMFSLGIVGMALYSYYLTQLPRTPDQAFPHFVAEARKVQGSLMRMHRDVRFSKDKRPYKTNVGIRFPYESSGDTRAPGFYVHLSPEEVSPRVGGMAPRLTLAGKDPSEDRSGSLPRVSSKLETTSDFKNRSSGRERVSRRTSKALRATIP